MAVGVWIMSVPVIRMVSYGYRGVDYECVRISEWSVMAVGVWIMSVPGIRVVSYGCRGMDYECARYQSGQLWL